MNAQGEDVVAGVRTPQTIDQLAEVMPEAYKQFTDICAKLEYHYRDMQDMEFTIEDKKLYMLQTRNGKAHGCRRDEDRLRSRRRRHDHRGRGRRHDRPEEPRFSPAPDVRSCRPEKGQGRRHGPRRIPGAACGQIVFSAETATDWAKNGTKGRPRPSGNFPRRYRGHALCAGRSDRPRRHDLPTRLLSPAAWAPAASPAAAPSR